MANEQQTQRSSPTFMQNIGGYVKKLNGLDD